MTGEDMAIAIAKCENEIKSLKHRVANCESEKETIRSLALSVNQLAVNMEYMLTEQKEQGSRLTALEKAPSDSFKELKLTVIRCLTSSVVGALLGALLTLIIQ